jgi:transcriptional regulator with XRE-family HTH domain
MTPLESPERRSAFCARLKSERERRGTSLRSIAESTKVKASLLEALERGDVSRWPKGIYRRSFFRDYVASFGLPSERYAAEFLELFPDGEELPPVSRPQTAAAGLALPSAGPALPSAAMSPLRLTLAQESGGWPLGVAAGVVRRRRLLQALAAVADVTLVLALAFAISTTGAASLELAAAAVACVYYSLGTALVGRSLGSWIMAPRRRGASSPRRTESRPPATAAAPQQAEPNVRLGVRGLASRTLRAGSTLGNSVVRLSRALTSTGKSQRRRDMSHLRRRRVETANRAVDEAV